MNENELTTEVASLAETVMALRVTDATSYKAASDVLLQAKDMQKRIVAYFKPLKESAFAAHKAVTAKEGSELAKIAPVEAHLKKQIGDYAAEQERLRKIEQARLDAIRAAEQAKLAEARRQEQARLDAEQRAEQARLDAIADAERKLQEEARAAAAAKAKAEGNAAEVARLAALPPPVVVAVVAAPVTALPPAPVVQQHVAQQTKPAGVPTRTVWDFEIFDAELVPREFLMIEVSAIRARVALLKEATIIPGVRVFSRQEVVAVRR